MPKKDSGFTLIELLVVIGILVILLTIVLVAVNPAFQLSQASDVRRKNDVNAILNAVGAYVTNNNGQLPPGITSTATNMGSGSGDVDICDYLVDRYIAEMPVDPASGLYVDCDDYDTDYKISTTGSNGRIIVESENSDLGDEIKVTR